VGSGVLAWRAACVCGACYAWWRRYIHGGVDISTLGFASHTHARALARFVLFRPASQRTHKNDADVVCTTHTPRGRLIPARAVGRRVRRTRSSNRACVAAALRRGSSSASPFARVHRWLRPPPALRCRARARVRRAAPRRAHGATSARRARLWRATPPQRRRRAPRRAAPLLQLRATRRSPSQPRSPRRCAAPRWAPWLRRCCCPPRRCPRGRWT
jgi:hypothetical protein